MEKREIKRALEKKLEVVTNLWRSLWHRFKKRRDKRVTNKDWTRKFLEWSRKCRKDIKRIKWKKIISRTTSKH